MGILECTSQIGDVVLQNYWYMRIIGKIAYCNMGDTMLLAKSLAEKSDHKEALYTHTLVRKPITSRSITYKLLVVNTDKSDTEHLYFINALHMHTRVMVLSLFVHLYVCVTNQQAC